MPQQRVNRTQRDSDIFNVVAFNRQQVIIPVAYQHKPMFGMVSDNAPDNLVGEPPYSVVRNSSESTCVNGNYHNPLPLLNYKCGN